MAQLAQEVRDPQRGGDAKFNRRLLEGTGGGVGLLCGEFGIEMSE